MRVSSGYFINQEGYLRDLLDKYQVEGTELQPIQRIEDEEDEVDPPLEVIRKAQGVDALFMLLLLNIRNPIASATEDSFSSCRLETIKGILAICKLLLRDSWIKLDEL